MSRCRLLMGLHTTLQELRLADNLLGDNLNPIFSTSEFHGLGRLRHLDLSGNLIKGIEEGILKGCDNLQVWTSCSLSCKCCMSRSVCLKRKMESLCLHVNMLTFTKSTPTVSGQLIHIWRLGFSPAALPLPQKHLTKYLLALIYVRG
jgi:hypothetical protein